MLFFTQACCGRFAAVPKLRSIQQILAAPALAIDQRGVQRLIANCITGSSGDKFMLAHGDNEVDRMPEESNSWREFIKSTGLYPYYVNPTGEVVHTMDEDADGRIAQGAVAVIPVQGALVREAWTYEEIFWGLVSADRLTKFIRKVEHDSRIAGAVATINSPGGMVSGTEKLGSAWAKLGKSKPNIAHVDDLAASAAYWFASQSRSIHLEGQTCEVGSVGVMLSFFDFIPVLESWGAKYHELYASKSGKKNEDWRQLREAKDPSLFKDGLDETAALFQTIVRSGRPALKDGDGSLEGRVFAGNRAVAVGMADSIADLEACINMVRSGTPASTAPPASDPESQLPPTVTDGGENALHSKTNTTMNTKERIIAFLAGLFPNKEAVTSEVITEANTQLREKGVEGIAVVTTEEQERVANSTALIAEAEQRATAATTERDEAVTARTNAETARDTAITERDAARATVTTATTAITEALTAHEVTVDANTDVVAAITTALASTRADLVAARKENDELKGQDAPSKDPSGAVQKTGDAGIETEASKTWESL